MFEYSYSSGFVANEEGMRDGEIGHNEVPLEVRDELEILSQHSRTLIDRCYHVPLHVAENIVPPYLMRCTKERKEP